MARFNSRVFTAPEPAPPTPELAAAYADRTLSALAKHYGTDLARVREWLVAAGISLRRSGQPVTLPAPARVRLSGASRAAFAAGSWTVSALATAAACEWETVSRAVWGRLVPAAVGAALERVLLPPT